MKTVPHSTQKARLLFILGPRSLAMGGVAVLALLLASCTLPKNHPAPLLRPQQLHPGHLGMRQFAHLPTQFQTGPGIATKTAQGVAIVWTNPPPKWTIYGLTNITSTNWQVMFTGTTSNRLQSVELYTSITNLSALSNQCGYYKLQATP